MSVPCSQIRLLNKYPNWKLHLCGCEMDRPGVIPGPGEQAVLTWAMFKAMQNTLVHIMESVDEN